MLATFSVSQVVKSANEWPQFDEIRDEFPDEKRQKKSIGGKVWEDK